MPETVKTTDVFGVSRDVPINYVTRESVDGELVRNLTRDKHLVIYGSSKQGKTCLRKYNLRADEYVVVTCSNRWNLAQVNTALLKQAGYVVEQSKSRTETGSAKVSARASMAAKLFGQGVDASVEAGGESGRSDTTVETSLELDPADVNEIIAALEAINFTKWIVLEDFHYLPEDTQRDFAVALKAFHESSAFVFIVVGVWLQQNRLIQYNGDLTGRVTTIDADAWGREELRQAILNGEAHLNVEFDDDFVDGLLDRSYDSIYVVQEGCLHACEKSGVYHRVEGGDPVTISADAEQVVTEVVDAQSGRYGEFLTNFGGGFSETELEMYKWILLPVAMGDSNALEHGLPLRRIRRILDKYHPSAPLNAGNVTTALKSAARLQVQQGTTPIVLDYDASLKRLNVVDRSFLIWLRHQDRRELLDTIGLPIGIVESWGEEEEEE